MAEPSERMRKLLGMLDKQPDDPFLLYGLAMEYKKAGDSPKALESFGRVLRLDPGYCYAYHQMGLIHEGDGDPERAKAAYRDGVAAAVRKGDAHAREEIQAALDVIEQG